MKSADSRKRDDAATARGLDCTHDGRVAVERHVRPVLVVVDDVGSDETQQMPLPEDDDVVEEFSRKVPTQRSANPFCHGERGAIRIW